MTNTLINMATEFTTDVIKLIKAIPEGKVSTYGQLAELAGKPQGARGVAWILNSSSKVHDLPWQRVVGTKGKTHGRIAFPKGSSSYLKQIRMLKKEGVTVDADGLIELAKFGWKKKVSRSTAKSRPRTPVVIIRRNQ